jgi:uncharacterized protein YprB with RNaseH-like and TPR domain
MTKLTKKQQEIYDFLMSKPGYLKKGLHDIGGILLTANIGLFPIKDIEKALKQSKLDYKKKFMTTTELEYVKDKTVKSKVINVVEDKKIDVEEAEQLINNLPKVTSKTKFKRLFFDIETSPNIVASWRVGYNLQIGPDNILQERAIICICYKWAHESKVHSLTWNKGDDKQMLVDFMKIMNAADEIIGHNSDKFDVKWVKTRALIHGIEHLPTYQTVDTLKLAKGNYLFNSNKLDYIGQVLGVGKKMDAGGFKTWKSIFIDHDAKALDKMVKYCKIDVIRLQQIYDKMNPYTKHKTHVGVALGKDKSSCPNCGGDKTRNQGFRYLASGSKKQCRVCLSCGKGFTLPEVIYSKLN